MVDLLITGGEVYDPANGIAGEVRDVWISGGKIVAPPSDPAVKPIRTINAAGLVIMPGGVDMHCHIAGTKVNTARKMRPEERRARDQVVASTPLTRSGTLGSVPSTFVTGYKYLGLGYTTAFDAAIPPLAARHAHEEFADTPGIDKGCFLLVGNNHYIFNAIRQQEWERLKHFLAWVLGAGKGYAPKLVNPGGVENWKQHARGTVTSLDDIVDHFRITPRQILREVVRTANELQLPHAAHIHCNQLGMPGNWRVTLDTMQAVEGLRAHLTHIQFHSYGGGDGAESTFCSQVEPLANYVNEHANLTVDVGQVMFGKTTSMTGDGPVGYFLGNLYKSKWFSGDVELEAGCGIAPIEYRNKSLVHALQWAIGLEWYLMVRDPWQIAMSTDHPNGGSFLAYPQIIHLLMDRAYREAMLEQCPPEIRQRSQLGDLTREYTLNEIAIITRAGPARMLGLKQKGHLGVGADADITLYSPHKDKQQMFAMPRYVIKAGEIVIDDGELRSTPFGKTLYIAPEYDPAAEHNIARWFDDAYSVRFANYPIPHHELTTAEKVSCMGQ
jgi:formylmethanofuran dehydrogenase subunit A